MEIKFHGQSCFELTDGDTTVLIDPFLKPNNPAAVATAEEVDATHIAISHGHADHIADAVAGRQAHRRRGVAIVELAELAGRAGGRGGQRPELRRHRLFDWGYVRLVPAWHTNTTAGPPPHGTAIGPAAGMLIKIGETTVYHAGDTCLFSDMKLIAERSDIDVFLVPIGGHYTMDRHDAVRRLPSSSAPRP